jgi:hypothetical protein
MLREGLGGASLGRVCCQTLRSSGNREVFVIDSGRNASAVAKAMADRHAFRYLCGAHFFRNASTLAGS